MSSSGLPRFRVRRWVLSTATLTATLTATTAGAQTPDAFRDVASILTWQNIGPDRGGRSLAASGSSARPLEYYFGAAGGGLWKTSDGGTTWRPVTDGKIRSSSIGAVAVAESSPDVVYIGTGEAQLRSDIRQGDGMYKSVDAGNTWTPIGLERTQAISRVRVDPRDPDRVYVAALGSPYGPSEERGIFRSKNGGKSWERILFRDRWTGGFDLVIDRQHPGTLWASLWQVRMAPGGGLTDGGPGSGLFKSVDGGDTWNEITRNRGLPASTIGNIGVTIAGTDPARVYALVAAEDGGLFGSDDGGESWTRVNQDGALRQRPTYFGRVTGDPRDRNTVFVLNLLLYRSVDGGRSFRTISPPHVDHHDLWIAPDDPTRMISSNDGGGSVSVTGGATWTAQHYPTAQFYGVAITGDLPYHVCGAQQDANTICVPSTRNASRSINPIVGQEEFLEPVYAAGGGESGSIAPDPRDPNVLYATGPQGLISRLDRRLGLSQARDHQVMPTWDSGPDRERFPWTIPLVFSPRDADVLYVASQHVWQSRDGGRQWTRISPDLSRPRVGTPRQGAISTLAPSPHDVATTWVGTDDGLVHLTRDGGTTWRSVTPPGVPDSSRVSAIAVSPHRPGTAFVTVTRFEVGDRSPYIQRTDDYGATWRAITTGLAEGDFVHAIREDPSRGELLYAGTEHGVRVSFDGGGHWESLQLDLPDTPVVDLVVARNDLVIATHGRSFYRLEGIQPLRRLGVASGGTVVVFGPGEVYRRLEEASIRYLLREPVTATSVEILDSTGALVRQLARAPASRPGVHEVRWDLRYDAPSVFPGMILWVGSAVGPLAAPGRYEVRITADGSVAREWFTVASDPRSTGSSVADLQEQFALARKVRDRVDQVHRTILGIQQLRQRIDARVSTASPRAATAAAAAVVRDLDAIEGELRQVRLKSELDATIYPIKLNNRLTNLQMSIETGDGRPTAQAYVAFESLSAEWAELERRLSAMSKGSRPALDRALKRSGLAGLDSIGPPPE